MYQMKFIALNLIEFCRRKIERLKFLFAVFFCADAEVVFRDPYKIECDGSLISAVITDLSSDLLRDHFRLRGECGKPHGDLWRVQSNDCTRDDCICCTRLFLEL